MGRTLWLITQRSTSAPAGVDELQATNHDGKGGEEREKKGGTWLPGGKNFPPSAPGFPGRPRFRNSKLQDSLLSPCRDLPSVPYFSRKRERTVRGIPWHSFAHFDQWEQINQKGTHFSLGAWVEVGLCISQRHFVLEDDYFMFAIPFLPPASPFGQKLRRGRKQQDERTSADGIFKSVLRIRRFPSGTYRIHTGIGWRNGTP